jgi:hypothetical protein
MPRVNGLGPRDSPCGVRKASKSDLDDDVVNGIIGGVDGWNQFYEFVRILP